MSQSALEIWTVALVIATALVSAGAIGTYHAQRRKAKLLSITGGKLAAKESKLDAAEEDLDIRQNFIREREKSVVHAYSYVTFRPETVRDLGERIDSVARKKLAQRIGYVLLGKFGKAVRRTDDKDGTTFRLDILVNAK